MLNSVFSSIHAAPAEGHFPGCRLTPAITRPSRVGLILLATLVLLAAPLWADKAGSYYKQGQRAEVHKQYDAAYAWFQRALDLHPDNVDYMIAARRTRFEAAIAHIHRGDQLMAQKQYPEAQVEFQKAATLDPSNAIAEQKLQQLQNLMHPAPPPPGEAVTPGQEDSLQQRLERAAGPVELGSVASTPINLKLAGDSRVAYNTLGKLSGINVIFDPDYHGSNVTLSLNQVSLMEALRILNIESRSFYTVVTPNTIFVTNDSLQKRSELQQMVVKTFYLHNISQAAELTEVAQAVRVLLNLQHFQPVASQMALVIRDTPDRVAVAQKIIDDLDKAPAEVVVDVKVLQVNRDVARDLGLLPPTSTTLSLVTSQPSSSSSGSSGSSGTGTSTGTGTGSGTSGGSTGTLLSSLKHLNGSNFAITITPATLNALLSNDATRTLQEPQLRAIQGQKATLQIGERIPIATGSFQPGIGGVGINPLVNTQFTYQPVGVNIDMTPWIHGDNEVTLKTKIEISAVDNFENIGGISQPVIGQKVIDHTIELKNGESNILGGIFEDQDIKNLSGIPGLSSIPGLKWLFSSTHNEKIHTEVMIVMTPHIVRHLDLSKFNERAIDTGTQNDITLHELPPATMAPSTASQAGQPAPQQQQPAFGPAPAAAAPTAPRTSPGTVPQPATGTPLLPRAAAAAPVTGAPGLQFNPSRVNGVVGNPFGVNLNLENVSNAYSISLQLNYDPRMVSLQSVVNGDFLGKDGQAVALVDRNDAASGNAQITLSRPPNVSGITGSGSILTLTFEGKAAGATTLSVSRVIARDAQGKIMHLQTGSAAVTIR